VDLSRISAAGRNCGQRAGFIRFGFSNFSPSATREAMKRIHACQAGATAVLLAVALGATWIPGPRFARAGPHGGALRED
jgi:hypothetical protein